VITAINQVDVSDQEKGEAKSSLRKLLGSKAAARVLGPGAQSFAAKYFTEYGGYRWAVVWRTKRNQQRHRRRKVLQPVTRCCDSRLR
jgi:hypothetical protein